MPSQNQERLCLYFLSLSLIGKSKSIESFKVSSLQSLWLLADDWAKSFLHYTRERCMVCAVLWKIWSMSVDTYPFYKLCMVRSGTSLIGTENLCGWAWLSIFSPRLLPFLSLILHLFIVHLPNYSTNPTKKFFFTVVRLFVTLKTWYPQATKVFLLRLV